MANNNTVKRYHKLMTGMPGMGGVATWGSLTTMLDAVLVNGFNAKTPTSIVRVDSTVTVNVTAHGYEVDQVIEAGGANQVEYNGEHRIISVTPDTYSYELPPGATPASPATTATAFTTKVAPLGFEIYKTGTNRRVYRTKDTTGTNRPCLRVDDGLTFSGTYNTDWAKYAKVSMAQDFLDVDTHAGLKTPVPDDVLYPEGNEKFVAGTTGTTINNGFFRWQFQRLPTSADAAGTHNTQVWRWELIGDSRGFHLFIGNTDQGYGLSHYCFTEFDSFMPGDIGNCYLMAYEFWGAANSGNNAYIGYAQPGQQRSNLGRRILADFTNLAAEKGYHYSVNYGSSNLESGVQASLPFPNPADLGLVLHENFIGGNQSGLRGIFPGVYYTPQQRPLVPLTVVSNVVGKPGRKFIAMPIASGSSNSNIGQAYIDLSGPWRTS